MYFLKYFIDCIGVGVTNVFPLSVGGLCLLGAYADSDDDESDVSEKTAQSKEANGNQSTDIDSTLANFLAVSDAFVYMFVLK